MNHFPLGLLLLGLLLHRYIGNTTNHESVDVGITSRHCFGTILGVLTEARSNNVPRQLEKQVSLRSAVVNYTQTDQKARNR